jgi:hypothetical protein
MKKIITILLISLLSASCVNEAKESTQLGNFKNEFLFEVDGCKMYRFEDGSRFIYWSDCRGKVNYDYTTGGKHKTQVRGETINN